MASGSMIHANWAILILTTFLAHMFTCGVSYTIGIYYVTFLDVFGESNGMTSWIGSLNTGTMCLAGLGYGMVFTSCVVVVATGTPKGRGLAMGVTFCGIGVGSFCYPFLGSWLGHVYDWRGALLLTSGLTLNVCLFGMFMIGGGGKKSRDRAAASRDRLKASRDGLPVDGAVVGKCNGDPCARTRTAESADLLVSDDVGQTSNMAAGSPRHIAFRSDRHVPSIDQWPPFSSLPLLDVDQSQTLYNRNGFGQSATELRRHALDLQDDFSLSDSSKLTRDRQLEISTASISTEKRDANCCHQLHACKLCSYWLLQSSTMFFFFSLSVALTHIFAYVSHQGMTERRATIIMSMNGAANLVGRLVLGVMTERRWMSALCLCLICYVTAGAACLGMTFWMSFPGFVACVLAFGFFWGACGPVLTESVLEVIGAEHFVYGYGFLMISMAIGTLTGAPTAGFLYDVSKKYTSSFYLGGTAMVLSGLLLAPVVLLTRRRLSCCCRPPVDDLTSEGLPSPPTP